MDSSSPQGSPQSLPPPLHSQTPQESSATPSSQVKTTTSSSSTPSFVAPGVIPPRTSSTASTSGGLRGIAPTTASISSVIAGDHHNTLLVGNQQETKLPRSNSGIMQHQQTLSAPIHLDRYAHDELDFTPERSWTQDKEKIIRGPYNYVTSHPGKDIRSQLIAAFNQWLEVPSDSLEIITRVVGMLHESSLLVDDVQDSSELRRGFPVAHSIFGVAQTINSANYIYFVGLQELLKLNNHTALETFADELVNLHRGQGMDLFWRDTLTCPSEDDYLEMVGNKTGGLFRLGIKLMQAESPHAGSIDCVPLVNLIGLIFQIRDDYINLASQEYSQHKGMCEDLTEGKFSFPIIHSIRSNPSDLQLINILKQKTLDVQVKRYAVTYMEGTGSFEYTRKVISTLIERARKVATDVDQGRGKVDGIFKILDRMAVE